jgi:hypothetical protein
MPAGESRPAAISNLNKSNSDFSPSWNEISKLAYFNYVNRGSSRLLNNANFLEYVVDRGV